MPLFVILIVFSITFYIFYKVKEVRSRAAYEKSWIASKAKIALGLFLLSFGLNEFTTVDDKIQLWVAIVFTAYGLFMMVVGYKMYKHYLPLAIQEAQDARSLQ